MKRLLSLLLLPVLVLALLTPCFAEDAVETTSGGYDIQIPSDWAMEDLIGYYIDTYGLNENNFSITVYCPDTGERYAFNEGTFFFAASTYKLPLNMYFYERQAEGVYSDDTYIGGTTLANAHYHSIVWSNNEYSHALIYKLGTFRQYKQLMLDAYGNMEPEEIDSRYWSNNYYCTKFMGNTLEYLYEHIDDFDELIGYMKQALPDQYLKAHSGDTEIAHKYGVFYDPSVRNDVGILFTEQPVLVAIYTSNFQGNGIGGEELIGRIGKALINYQTQRTELDRLAQEEAEAAARAESEALALEAAARAESEQASEAAASESEAIRVSEEASEQAAAEASRAAQEQAELEAQRTQRMQYAALIAVGAVMLLVALTVLIVRHKRSGR